MLPDGTLADVKVDFETLRELSRLARDEYGLGGAVQHGASTLPPSAFGKFPEVGTVEIHLATNFQNIIYDNLPDGVVDTAYNYILSNLSGEWKEGQTEDQFIYSTRKKAIGPFKKMWWDLPAVEQEKIGRALQDEFEFLFDKLGIAHTRDFANTVTTIQKNNRPRPSEAVVDTKLEIASDLAD